jgi:hypothetical protein
VALRVADGVTVRLTAEQARLMLKWIANGR